MNEVVALVLVLLLATSGYAAGRMHGQFSYRLGYRFGYRQGYFDGDRASWSRRRRELQAVVASVLATPPDQRSASLPAGTLGGTLGGTTYASEVTDDGLDEDPRPWWPSCRLTRPPAVGMPAARCSTRPTPDRPGISRPVAVTTRTLRCPGSDCVLRLASACGRGLPDRTRPEPARGRHPTPFRASDVANRGRQVRLRRSSL